MPLHDRRCGTLDGGSVGDVADLVLAAELLREGPEPVLPPGEEDAAKAAACKLARDRGADAARRAGDDGYLQSRTVSRALAVRPVAAVATAKSLCVAPLAFFACQSAA